MSHVPITVLGPSRKKLQQEALGESLGKGLANFANNYFANKALDKVLESPDYEKSEPSKRMSSLQRALQPYGETGLGILQQRLGIEQQIIQDKQQKQFDKMNPEVAGLPPEMQKIYLQQKNNQKIVRDLEVRRGLERGSLSAYENDPKMAEQITRPNKEKTPRLSEQPINPDQKIALDKARNVTGFNDMDELEQYRTMVDNGVSPELADKESKLRSQQLTRKGQEIEKSYVAQKDFIDDITASYKGFETEMKPRLLQMRNIKDEDLISPTAAVFLESLGIPLGALDDPSSELYQKLSQDLLKGLPETYGNRILKVEVDNFLKTIPTLMNSADGRRMIASNMLKLGEMKEVYYNEMRSQQKHYLDENKSFPKDFQQRIFDQVKPQIDRINNEFVKLSEIKSVPDGTIPFFNPNGNVEFVPKEHAQWASEHGGRRVW